MNKKYWVTLEASEREERERLLAHGKADVRRLKHVQLLLKAAQGRGGPGWSDERIAEAIDVGLTTVERIRKRFVEEGLASALRPYRGGKRIYERRLDGEQEAHLIALACSAPPEGQARRSLRLLARRMVELSHVDALSHETVRQTLKKTRSSRTGGGCGAFRPSTRPSSSTTSRTSSRSTIALMIRSDRSCASTRPSSNSSARRDSPCRPGPAQCSAAITSMCATAWPACSSPASRWSAGATSR